MSRQIIQWAESEYHADRTAVSKSWLDWIHRSPAHLRAYLEGLIEVTPAQEFGILVHAWVLEPDSVGSRFIKEPKINRRTNAGKAEAAEFAEKNKDKTVVKAELYDEAMKVRDAVYRNKAAAAILGKGEPEQSVLWTNPETGELCKARADWLRENFTADVKTTNDASPTAFAKSMANFRYPVQAAHYREGFESPKFVWIVVEKKPPYGVAVYADSDEILLLGKRHRDADLRTYAECKAKDRWPCYPEAVQSIELPRWAK